MPAWQDMHHCPLHTKIECEEAREVVRREIASHAALAYYYTRDMLFGRQRRSMWRRDDYPTSLSLQITYTMFIRRRMPAVKIIRAE